MNKRLNNVNTYHLVTIVVYYIIYYSLFLCVCACVRVRTYVPQCIHGSQTRMLKLFFSFYLVDPRNSSGHQTWWQVNLPAEPSC